MIISRLLQITSEGVNDYVVTTPVSRRKTNVEYVTCTVTTYERLNKTTLERTPILEIGAPEVKYVYFRSGLFRRGKRKLAVTVENVTVKRGYERHGVTERGFVKDGEIREKNRKRDEKKAKKLAAKETKAAKKQAKRDEKKSKKELSKKDRKEKKSDTGSDS